LNPDSFEAHANLGEGYFKLERFSDAIASLKRAIELKPDSAEAHDYLGAALLKVGDRENAMEQFQMIKNLKPEFQGELAKLLRTENSADQQSNSLTS